jgi:GNAT superfamily N-acetyltransferase
MRITPMAVGDVDEVVGLYVDVFSRPPWDEPWTTDDARRCLGPMLAAPGAVGVVAHDDGVLVGMALGAIERQAGHDVFLLREMCVRAARQRSGVGRALLDALEQRLDVESWYLLTARESPAAAFYESSGFRRAGRMAVWVRP